MLVLCLLWLAALPLTAAAIDEEILQWAGIGIDLKVRRKHRENPA